MLWVADTGPLLHLHQAGILDLLHFGGEVRTTPVVVEEWCRRVRGATLPPWVRIDRPDARSRGMARDWQRQGILDRGEAEAFAHAVVSGADGFLTDDTAAREFARGENLIVRRSLGVLLMAAARKGLSAARARVAWRRLSTQSTLWISPALRRENETTLERILQKNSSLE